ncbi:MAG: HNH endonuclease family protein [Aeromicrobium sp.]
MRLLRSVMFLALLVFGILLATRLFGGDGGGAAKPGSESSGATIATTFHRAVTMLEVEPEDRRPYSRSRFEEGTAGGGWADLDGDCQDTRAEVLKRASLVPVTNGCRIYRGKWLSYYDNKAWTRSYEVQIDHLVPLAEAWDSGAWAWDAPTRLRYANDLDDPRALVPTTAALNYVKLADDPQAYVPKMNACRYVSSWVAIKLRWGLTVDRREIEAIDAVAASCPDVRLAFEKTTVGKAPA